MSTMQALCEDLALDQATLDMWEAEHFDEAVGGAASDRWSVTAKRIAATPSLSSADLAMKAAALETVIAGLADRENHTIAQLALSLARDVLVHGGHLPTRAQACK